MSGFRAEDIPGLHEPELLELTPVEQRMLKGEGPTAGQLQHIYDHPAFRYLMAKVKQGVRKQMNDFLAATPIPKALECGSPREAYFTGVVSANRSVLHLQKELMADAKSRESEDEEPAPSKNPEEDFFDEGVLGR